MSFANSHVQGAAHRLEPGESRSHPGHAAQRKRHRHHQRNLNGVHGDGGQSRPGPRRSRIVVFTGPPATSNRIHHLCITSYAASLCNCCTLRHAKSPLGGWRCSLRGPAEQGMSGHHGVSSGGCEFKVVGLREDAIRNTAGRRQGWRRPSQRKTYARISCHHMMMADSDETHLASPQCHERKAFSRTR